MRRGDDGATKTNVRVPDAATVPGTAARAGAVMLEEPDGLERYETKDLLGRGGMGTVLLVHDRRIGRDVALKELTPGDGSSGDTHGRFAREARLQGQLEHPAIVPVYDIGTKEDGTPFFTMKQVRGESLAKVLADLRARSSDPNVSVRLKGGLRFSRRKLLSAFSQLCVAVHYAHERGVVHRDIKPSNVMLGAYGEVYLIDWGVAKVLGAPDDEAVAPSPTPADGVQTAFGAIIGSVHTMAPEQAIGGAVDARADVYALGAILFEILTGEALHPRGDVEDVLGAIARGVESRPSVRTPSVDVPPELEVLCVAATRPNPNDRLDSAMAIHDAIEEYLDGDRDLRIRKEGARRHAERAKLAADEVLLREAELPQIDELLAVTPADTRPGGIQARAEALQEVGRALALDPENEEALQTLVRLLTASPKVPPREVIEEYQRDLSLDIRNVSTSAAVVYGGIVAAAVPTWLAVGRTDLRTFVVAHVFWGAAFVAALVARRRRTLMSLLVMYIAALSATVWISAVFSPLVLVPVLLAAHAASFASTSLKVIRRFVSVTSALALVLSLAAEATGLLPDTIRVVNGDLLLHSEVFHWSEASAIVYLGLTSLVAILAPTYIVSQLSQSSTKAFESMLLQRWQLRQITGTTPTKA